MKCILWNAQSINNKIVDLIQILVDNSICICLLTETWFKIQHNHVTSLLNESGYRICHFHRTEKKGGGVAIICKQQYRPKFEKSFEYTSFN